MAFSWLVNRGDPNHLQVLGWSSKYTMNCDKARLPTSPQDTARLPGYQPPPTVPQKGLAVMDHLGWSSKRCTGCKGFLKPFPNIPPNKLCYIKMGFEWLWYNIYIYYHANYFTVYVWIYVCMYMPRDEGERERERESSIQNAAFPKTYRSFVANQFLNRIKCCKPPKKSTLPKS